MKEESSWEIMLGVAVSIWKSVTSMPWIVLMFASIGAFFMDLWLNLALGIIGIVVLSVIDTHVAIKACKSKGGKYQSELIKKGLLNKVNIYAIATICGIVLDLMFRKLYDYDKFFMTFLFFAVIAVYESGSIFEKLAVLDPENKVVAKIAKYLNLADKKLDDKFEDKLK